MSAVLNDRDAILQAATVRIVNPKNAWINLQSSAPGFHLNTAGQVDLGVVTVTADLVGLDDAVTFSATGATLSNAVGRSVDVTYAGQTAIVTAIVVSNGDEFKRSIVIPVLRDGASGTSTPGAPGARGAGHYYATGSTWSDVVAQAACPGSTPVLNDVVTISSSTYVMEKRWTGSAWVENGVVVNGKLIAPDSILTAALAAYAVTAEKLAVGAVEARHISVSGDNDNLIRDTRFKDLAWWGLNGAVIPADWNVLQPGANTGWKHNASLYMAGTQGAPVESWGTAMPVIPGATYLAEYQVALDGDFQGELSITLYLPWYGFYTFEQPAITSWASDGLPVQYASNSPRNLRTVVKALTIPNDVKVTYAQIYIRRSVRAGQAQIGGFSLTRMTDASLVVKGGIKADHIDVDRLAAIIAYLGNVELGAGGAVRQGMSAFNVGKGIWLGDDNGTPKLAVGDPAGAGITYDGVSLIVNKADFGSFTAVLSGGGMTSSGPNGARSLGSRQMTGSGGKLPYRSFSWTVTDLEGNAAARTFISGESTDTVSVTGSGTNATTRVRITGTIIDANGLAASTSFISTASFGAV